MNYHALNLKSDGALRAALDEASQRKPSAEELVSQRISFIMSSVTESSGITRAQVEQVLREQEGISESTGS